jgi:predicted transcriptional regulator of viral defense system
MNLTHSQQQILDLATRKGAVKAKDLAALGLPREYLARMASQGLLTRIARGVYRTPDAEFSEHHELALVASRVPNGVICLISALSFHQIGTESPHQVWVALKAKSHPPKLDYPRLRYSYFSGAAFELGVEKHTIEGVEVAVYSPAKTVVDCFRLRNKIGLDVALEALREGWCDKRFTVDELMTLAQQCRIAAIIRPHFEMLVA